MASKNNKVNGGFMVLLGKRVGDLVFMPILCQTTLGLGRQLNTIDASSKCGKDIAIDEEDGTVTMEGFMLKAGLTDVLTSKDLEDLYNSQDEADYMIGVVDPAGKAGLVSYRFSGVILQKQITMNNNEKSKSSITITTTTPVETGVILPSGAILWDSDAKVSGYTFDWGIFLSALDTDLPASYQQEATNLFAPGIYKTGKIAGIGSLGKLVEYSFSRAGSATYIDKDGLLKSAAANQPRIDYSSGRASYLIEAASNNLCTQSNDISNGYWLKAPSVSATGNTAVSIDGTMNASLINITGGTSAQIYTSSVAVTPGSTITISAYIKMGTKKSGYRFRVIDADTQSIIVLETTDYTSQLIDGKISRVQVQATVPAGTSNLRVYLLNESSSVGGTFEISHVQIEATAKATSPILTSGSVGVRAADNLSTPITVTDIGSLTANYLTSRAISLLIKDSTNRISIRTGSGQFYASASATYTNQIQGAEKTASYWDTAGLKVSAGGAISPSVPYTAGSYIGGLSMLYSNERILIRTMAIFSRKFTDDEAKSLTK